MSFVVRGFDNLTDELTIPFHKHHVPAIFLAETCGNQTILCCPSRRDYLDGRYRARYP